MNEIITTKEHKVYPVLTAWPSGHKTVSWND